MLSALAEWQRETGDIVAFEEDESGGMPLVIALAGPDGYCPPDDNIGTFYDGIEYYRGPTRFECIRPGLDAKTFRDVVLHETGHVLRLRHDDSGEPSCITSSVGHSAHRVTAADVLQFCAMTLWC